MEVERSLDPITCVMGVGWKRVLATGSFRVVQFGAD